MGVYIMTPKNQNPIDHFSSCLMTTGQSTSLPSHMGGKGSTMPTSVRNLERIVQPCELVSRARSFTESVKGLVPNTTVNMQKYVGIVQSVASIVHRSSSNIPVSTTFSCCAFSSRRRKPLYCKWSTINQLWGRKFDHSAPTVNIYTSPSVKGLEEFFPRTDDILNEGEKSGRYVYSELNFCVESGENYFHMIVKSALHS